MSMEFLAVGEKLGDLRGDMRTLGTAVQALAQKVDVGERREREMKAIAEQVGKLEARLAALEAWAKQPEGEAA